MDAWEKFKIAIKKDGLVNEGDRIILAVSGGPDSVCLTHLFWRLAKALDLELVIVYFDHGLRVQAKKEIFFIKKLGGKLNIPVQVRVLKVKEHSSQNKVSIETAGRDLRYQELDNVAKELKFNKIVTGHNANDNAETVLMWLIRGTGAEGLSGIPPKRKTKGNIEVIRPILSVTRKEILTYLKRQKMFFCIDRSNFDIDYTRNKIRHELIPMLNKYNSNVVEHLYNLSRIVSRENTYLNMLSQKAQKNLVSVSKNKISLDLKGFFGYNKAIQNRIIKNILPQKRSQLQIERLMDFLSAPHKKNIHFSSNWEIEKSPGKLVIKKLVQA
ncbi:MAG: tRNA lysidine(34) synthetase TilS [Elusimicrobia bacterium]|nr:tRNA lysidine(34) synthetase TilS [Candidatus Liberimonas magnetica]